MKKSSKWQDLELFLIWKINIKTPHNAFVLTPFHSFNSFNSQIGTMENQHKDTHNTFVLTPFHSFNSFNSRFISLHFTPSTPLTPK